MGMFDSFYDAKGNEWQTKAFGCNLDKFHIGDIVPVLPSVFQVEVIGGDDGKWRNSYVTIRNGVVVSVDDLRDDNLPLVSYTGGVSYSNEFIRRQR